LDTRSMLKGDLMEQMVRCGKATCHCREGKLHGPYHYRVWREGEKIRKEYVRPEDAENVREACLEYRNARRFLRGHQTQAESLNRAIRSHWRESRKIIEASRSPRNLRHRPAANEPL